MNFFLFKKNIFLLLKKKKFFEIFFIKNLFLIEKKKKFKYFQISISS